MRAGEARFSDHFLLNHPDRAISIEQAEAVLCDPAAESIERHRDRQWGPTVLVYGVIDGRAVHVLCSEPPEVTVITAWWPDSQPEKWSKDYRRRARGR